MSDEQSHVRAFLKRQTETVMSISVLGGGFVALLSFFGGVFPPFPTVGQFSTLESRVNAFIATYNGQLCYDARRRLRNATTRLNADPSNVTENLLAEAARREIFQIQGCTTEASDN